MFKSMTKCAAAVAAGMLLGFVSVTPFPSVKSDEASLGMRASAEELVYEDFEYSETVFGGITIKKYLGWKNKTVEIPETIDEKYVTGIDSSAFRSHGELTSVVLPSHLVTIGNSAFSYCGNLTDIVLPEGLYEIGEYAWNECNKLSELKLPSTLQRVGYGMLFNTAVTSINIPAALNSADEPFYGSNIQEVTFEEGRTVINSKLFTSCYTLEHIEIPEGVTVIETMAFLYCKSLSNVTLPNSLTKIGSFVFSNCKNLKEITLPENLQSIGAYAFSDCTELSAMQFPDSLKNIDGMAFRNDTTLEQIILPDSVTILGQGMLEGCTELQTFVVRNPDCKINDYETTIPENCIIYGYTDSTAQAYAKKYNRKFAALDADIKYDFNADSTFSMADVILYLRFLAEDSDIQMVPCDVDGDDLLTISDVNLLLWQLQQKQ